MAQLELPPGVPDFESFVKQRQAELIDRKREKKRSGIPLWPNFAATKGAGVSAQIAAALASKIGIMALFSVISAVAGGAGLMQRMQLQHKQDEFKKKQFQATLLRDNMLRENQSLKSAVPTVDGARNDTVGFVKAGELAGPTAADAAAAAAAASKEGDGANGAGGANKGDVQPAAPDANAMAEAMMAQAGAPGGAGARAGGAASGYGKLSNGMGGMRGGGGMSGGVGRGFDQMNMKNTMLAKAQGLKGGNDAGIVGSKSKKGQMRNWLNNRNVTSGVRSSATANRLRQMSADMSANKKADIGKSAQANTTAWDAASPGAQALTGPGASAPAAMTGSSTGGGPEPGEGGPINMGSSDLSNDVGSHVPDIPEYKNVTPYQWAIDLAKMLMYAIMALSVVIMILKSTGWGATAVPALVGAVGVLGGILAALGIYMIALGQYLQGTMYTVIGGLVAIASLAAPAAVSEVEGAAAWQFGNIITYMLASTAAAGVGVAGDAIMENNKSGAYDDSEHRDAYKKKYGVDPDTKQVLNPEKFDKRYGEGATDDYNKQREFDDMR